MPASAITKLFFCFIWLFSSAAFSTNFNVDSAQVSKIGNGHVLNAKLSYPLTPRVRQALENGVPITFQQHFEVVRSLPILADYFDWTETIWSNQIRFELRYHALTEQHVLLSLDTLHQRSFPSLESALSAMGTIENLNLPPEHLADTNDLRLRIKTNIDLHALPTPMRPGAFVSSKWQLDSPWVEALWL